jgi:(E)-4-hydroxy-3-methylbut-2-enyl-diphosphate synthase
MNKNLNMPVLICGAYPESSESDLQLFASTDMGGLLTDGLGEGIMLGWSQARSIEDQKEIRIVNQLAFGILQAARTRMSKTEYISCPSCGRTLFDLQETTAMIRKRTDHLKGVKIGIMGCIVNGPGEMADADYGYVGVGKDKIALYRGQNVVKKAVPSASAVDELIDLIREDGKWTETEVHIVSGSDI